MAPFRLWKLCPHSRRRRRRAKDGRLRMRCNALAARRLQRRLKCRIAGRRTRGSRRGVQMRLLTRGRSSRGSLCTVTVLVGLTDDAVLRLRSRTQVPPGSGPSGPYTLGAPMRSSYLNAIGGKGPQNPRCPSDGRLHREGDAEASGPMDRARWPSHHGQADRAFCLARLTLPSGALYQRTSRRGDGSDPPVDQTCLRPLRPRSWLVGLLCGLRLQFADWLEGAR